MSVCKYLCPVLAALALSSCSERSWEWKGDVLYDARGDVVGRLESGMSEGIREKHSIRDLGDGTFKVEWVFTAEKDLPHAEITADFVHASDSDYWMIPSISYNGNDWGRGHEPKGASENGVWRTYSYRRTPVPGAVYSESGRYAVATWSDVPAVSRDDFSCCVMPEEGRITHRLLWPEQERPSTYTKRDTFDSGWERDSEMEKDERKTVVMYVCVSDIQPEHRAMGKFLKICWDTMPHPSMTVPPADRIWEYGTEYFKRSLWSEEGTFKGFSIGLTPAGDTSWVQRPRHRYEAGWCGQNISVACSLLWDHLNNSCSESLEKGLATLDSWADNCRLPNGLFVVMFDDLLDGKQSDLDACNLGTAALNFFQAYDLAGQCGYDRPNYLEIALDICNFAISDQQEDGCFARGWKYDGSCIVREGTVGCFLLPAITEAYRRTSDGKYLDSAIRAYAHYRKQLFEDGFTTAGALDTWCIDKESAISILRSSLALYGLTGEDAYLDDAVQTSYYLSTWLWHYDEIYPEDDQFTQYGYHTFGGTSVSTQHHHLDYYATLWVPEWIELSELTGDRQWLVKAQAIWANSTQLISDGTFRVNGRLRPLGSQNEAWYECSWGFNNKVNGVAPPASRPDRINDWLVAWPSAFRLETCRKLSQKGKLNMLVE